MKCAVNKCENENNSKACKISFFNFPSNPGLLKQWIYFCDRKRKFNAKTSHVCMEHFKPEDFENLLQYQMGFIKRLFLKRGAVPTVRDISSKNEEAYRERESRIQKRENKKIVEMLLKEHSAELQKDEIKMGEICAVDLSQKAIVCVDHFAPSAVPIKNLNVPAPKDQANEVFENQEKPFSTNSINSNSATMPPQLEEEPLMEIPVIKSVSCSAYSQTNTRLCGLVQASDLADEFRFNCFYCLRVFPLEKWKEFTNHLKKKHFQTEEAFKTVKYISKDHDYTPIYNPSSTSIENTTDKTLHPVLMDPLGPTNNPFESVTLNPAPYYEQVANKFISLNKNILNNFPETGMTRPQQMSEKPNVEEMELKRTEEEETSASIIKMQQIPTEISFEFTPPEIVYLLLDSMKRYPVLWQFDDEPFNQDFYEAVEDLCKIINNKWSLNIDNLKMRRSINRILRYYCYLYPNTDTETVDQFACYYERCAVYLPHVNEVAYARCSHCYTCFKNDFELKGHLGEEQKYLQWPYKCIKCKECFRKIDEYEFHKHMPHYDETFRCEPCNRTFFHRNMYTRHVVVDHPKDDYKCNICDKSFQTVSGLKYHKSLHGERKYKCNLCPKSFFHNSKLRVHLKSHRKEYDFMCEICGKGFIRQTGLTSHMKKHTGVKVTCSICNLKLRKSSLNRHLRLVHVPYTGTIATKARPSSLYYRRLIRSRPTRPIRRKGENRKYYCKICKVFFENYKLVAEHNKELHYDIPKWPCQMCETAFSHKINLKRHYRRKHNLNVIQAYKLVDEKEDLNTVLALKSEDLEALTDIPSGRNNEKLDALTDSQSCRKNEELDALPDSQTDQKTEDLNASNDSQIVSKNEIENATKSNIKTPIKSNLLPDEIFSEKEEDEKMHSYIMQDEIIKVVDNIETQEINVDYMNDLFTDLFTEH